MNTEHSTYFRNHDVARGYSAAQPINQSSRAIGVIEMLHRDIHRPIPDRSLAERVQAQFR